MRVVGNCVQYRERHSNRKLIFGHIFRQHRLILSALVLGYPVLDDPRCLNECEALALKQAYKSSIIK